jgi:hypothetical protein
MAEQILPGVYIEVRPEALIVGGPVSVGNIGIVGTAEFGPVNEAQVFGSYADAISTFGPYDAFDAPEVTNKPLTLVRALEIAYRHGASKVFAVRVAGTTPAPAAPASLGATNDANFSVQAKTAGTAGNQLKVKITHPSATEALVTFERGSVKESYTVTSVNELKTQAAASSLVVVSAKTGGSLTALPDLLASTPFVGGESGADASPSDYEDGLAVLLNQDAHIIVAAGLSDDIIADELNAHVQAASTDEVKRDRIAVVGSRPAATPINPSAFIAAAGTPALESDRVIYVMPGIKANDAAAKKEVTLPGAYAAAAIAGMLSARAPHISLTNKVLNVGALEVDFNAAQLSSLVQAGVLALEHRRGQRVVKGITTDPGAFQQITTRRIVDFAKFGVRAAAEPYIGLLNNDRVRKALKGSINGFLADMVTDEMLESYDLDVTATRDDEIRGIARVTMTVRPTFSIDFIKVVMFLG